MAGPWEDYQTPAVPQASAERAPWLDYQTAPKSRGPWEDYQPQAQAQAAPSSGGGLVDKAREIDRALTEGLIESTFATPLRGVGAQAPEFARQQLSRLGNINQPLPPDATSEERAAYKTRRGVQHPSEETIAERQKPFEATATMLPQEHPIYQAGEAVSRSGKQYVGPQITDLPPLVRDVASGAGSVAGNIGIASIPGIGLPLMVGATTQQGAGEAAERAVKAGATPGQVSSAAALGTIPGATEFVDALLPTLGSTGKALGLIQRVGLRALHGALIEGGQEGLQQLIQNAIAKGVYKPDQDIFEDVRRSALVGAIVGGGTSAALGGHGEARPEEAQTPGTQEEVQASLTSLLGTPLPPTLAPPEPVPAPAVVLPQQPAVTPVTPETPPPSLVNPPVTTDMPSEMPPEVSSFIQGNVAKLATPTTEEHPAVVLARQDVAQNGFAPLTDEQIANLRQNFGADGIKQYIDEWSRLKREADKLQAPDTSRPQYQEIIANSGGDWARLAKLLGPKLYGDPSGMTTVSVKEMVQNSFDAVKDTLLAGAKGAGNIAIKMNRGDRTIAVVDDGVGMTPEILGNQFIRIAETKKGSDQASGGLGIAKMLFLFGNQALAVTTMRNGKVSRMVTTGADLLAALNDPSRNPRITISPPTMADKAMFPKGHGTAVVVKVPETYKDTATGEMRNISFSPYSSEYPVLNFSPLFHDINVTFNGETVPGMGKDFNLDSYTQFANVNFDWGTARVYVTKKPSTNDSYQDNIHVLSNGLWQFSLKLPKDEKRPYGPAVNRTFYFDVRPKVRPEDPGYPFDLNRQSFSPTVKKDFEQIIAYMGLLYKKEEFANDVKNYGDVHYVSVQPDGTVYSSDRLKVEPKLPPGATPLTMIHAGDTVTVKDGKLIVKGRTIPELKPEDLANTKLNLDELIIDQKEIDPNRVMIHDNVNVTLSGAMDFDQRVAFLAGNIENQRPLPDPFEQQPFMPEPVPTSGGGFEVRSMVELGRERFGARFDRYVHDIGASFIHLRDVVADAMNTVEFADETAAFGIKAKSNAYDDMKNEAVGISFDVMYRGVSIRVPFAGFFVNPAATEYRDPLRAAIGIVGTMVHELAHHKVRDHDEFFPAEMQRIIINLDAHPTFNFHSFKQGVVNIFAANEDISKFLYGVLDGSVGPISSRGKQFKGSRNEQARDAGPLGQLAEAVPGPGGARESTAGLAPSAQSTRTVEGPADVSIRSPAEDIAAWFRDQYVAVASGTQRASEPGGAVHFEEIAALTGKSPQELGTLAQIAVDAPGPKTFSLARQTREGTSHLRLRISGREYTGIKILGQGSAVSPQMQANVRTTVSKGSGGPADNGLSRNQTALNATGEGDAGAVPIQPETRPIRDTLSALYQNNTPPSIRSQAAHADKMNRFYKWMAGLHQLVQRNRFFTPLLRYYEGVRDMHIEESKLHDAALRLSRDWRDLGTDGDKLTGFLDELTRMTYRSKTEIANGEARHPSKLELDRLKDEWKLSPQAIILADKIKKLTDGFLQLVGLNAIEHAKRTIQDPGRLQAKIRSIQRDIQALAARPYFPFMRFGRHFVAMKDPAGKLIHFETVEGQGFDRLMGKNIAAEREQQRRKAALKRQYQRDYGVVPNDQQLYHGVLPESVGPLIGMPQMLLEQMSDTQLLTPAQMQNINDLTLAMALGLTPTLNPKYQRRYFRPGQSVYTPGYSMDFRRSFARFFFHGAKFYSKTKYLDGLKDLVQQAKSIPGNKEGYIAEYMTDHLNNTVLDARGDFGIFKAAIFFWAMGYVPAAATQNLSQTPMITFPFLGAKFGDVKAVKAMARAMRQMNSFYKRGFYDNQSDFELKALGYGIKTGRISETQAPALAGISQATNLLKGIGGNVWEQNWVAFMEKAAFMFEMAEQLNRRIAYRAALDLATKNPTAKFVDEAVHLNETEYQRLLAEGIDGAKITEAQARAIVTANHVVEETQYQYSAVMRPRFMRGKAGILFVFKMYIQSTLMMLGNNKRDVLPRYMLISAFIGGLAGLPFAEDLLSIFKALWAWMGYGTNLEHEARRHILQFSDGRVDPDIVLHGMARRGLGYPALLDMLGSFATGTPGRGLAAPKRGFDPATNSEYRTGYAQNIPFPVLDRSRALGLGMIAPFDIGKFMTPAHDQDRTIAEQAQKASGAVFSVAFNIYKSIMDKDLALTDPKRWERSVPRQLADMSRAWRTFSEGRERSKGGPAGGSTIVPFNPRDTEEMMEIMAIAGGYQPLRIQARWDNIMAKMEVEKFYDLQRNGLLGQLHEAVSSQREPDRLKTIEAIKQFNAGLPEWARGKAITSETATKSLQAKERGRVARESGIPIQKTNVPIAREIDKLFPESTVDVRRVR